MYVYASVAIGGDISFYTPLRPLNYLVGCGAGADLEGGAGGCAPPLNFPSTPLIIISTPLIIISTPQPRMNCIFHMIYFMKEVDITE